MQFSSFANHPNGSLAPELGAVRVVFVCIERIIVLVRHDFWQRVLFQTEKNPIPTRLPVHAAGIRQQVAGAKREEDYDYR